MVASVLAVDMVALTRRLVGLGVLLMVRLCRLDTHHHLTARISHSPLHLCILAEEARILHLGVTISELVLLLLLGSLPVLTIAIHIFGILFLLDDRLNLIILELAVARVVLSVRQWQDVATLI